MKQVFFELAENMFGKIKPEIIRRINKYIKNPTTAGWEDIHCIIIDRTGRMKTIWNAINDIDPFFPRYGRRTDIYGNILRDWEQTPSPEKVIEAINKCVLGKELNNHKN
jgi:hypothetical protein